MVWVRRFGCISCLGSLGGLNGLAGLCISVDCVRYGVLLFCGDSVDWWVMSVSIFWVAYMFIFSVQTFTDHVHVAF